MFVRYLISKSLRIKGFGHGNIIGSTQNMSMILYGDEASPPVRFVMITASLLKMDYKFNKIDLFSGENKTEYFAKLNPLQKVPVLVVGQEVICDSHAIALYLCRQKGIQDLYPKDPIKRARVDQMIFFNSGSLFPLDSSIFTDYFSGKWTADNKRIEQWYYLLDYLEYQLAKHLWLAGDKMTLCDICCATTVSSLNLLVPILKHDRVRAWLVKLQELPCFEINSRGIFRLESFVEKVKQLGK